MNPNDKTGLWYISVTVQGLTYKQYSQLLRPVSFIETIKASNIRKQLIATFTYQTQIPPFLYREETF